MEKIKVFYQEKKDLIFKVALILIIAIGILLRGIQLDKIPIGINVDEAGIAYDAYSIANYGVDRFLYHNPVYTINYGGGQSVLYTYLAAGIIKLMGFSLLAVRLPAFLLSSISIIVFYFLVKQFQNKKLAIICTLLIVINPWHFMQSRWGLDCNLMSSMLLISTFVLLKSKQKWCYVLSGILWGITLYSYALSYIIVPILLLGILIYLLKIKKIKILDIVCLALPLGILAIPPILNLLVNIGWIEPITNPIFSTPKLWQYRGAEISLQNVINNIFPIMKIMFGYDINDYNAFPQFGTVYYISIPFFILGIVKCIKDIKQNIRKNTIHLGTIFCIYFLSIFICLLLIKDLSISKANGIYIPILYFIALGIYNILQQNKKVFVFIISLYILLFCIFQYYYFGIYGQNNRNTSFNKTTIEAVQYIEDEPKFEGKYISINTTAIQPYIYTLIANQTSPYDFHQNLVMNGAVFSYGNYIFYYQAVNDNVVYVFNTNHPLKQKLLQNGFKSEKYNGVEILYKEN